MFDLPPLRFEVTEHQILAAQCTCGNICRGELPDGIFSPVQYGLSVLAAVVHLSHHLRLRNYADDVWRFATDHHVPFTNNIAEQAVRMPKFKQNISGCFRTKNGADTFCTLRSDLATMHKRISDHEIG